MKSLARIARIRSCRLGSTATSSATSSAEKATSSEKKKKDDWKTELLTILEAEHKQKKRVTWKQRVSQNAVADIVRFSLRDDIQSLVRLTENQLRTRFAPEILPICFMVLNKKFERILKKMDLIEAPASLSLFLGIADLWKSLKRNETNTTNLVTLLLMSNIRKWKDQRSFDKKSSKTIEDLFDSMQKKMVVHSVNTSDQALDVFLTPEDLKTIQKELDMMRKFYIPLGRRAETRRYSEDLGLVAPLQNNPEEYHGNPFQVEHMEKETYKSLFEEHLKVESTMWVQVKNTVGELEKGEVSGETLIDQWHWRKRIGDGLRKIDPNQTHPIVATCLELLPREKLIDTLYFSVVAACSQGQNLIGATQFQFDVIEPILKELGNAFKKEMGFDETAVWKRVFDVYIDYFLDPEVSRQHTHREWWSKACKTQNLAPDFQFQMGNMDVETRDQVCNVIINVLFDSCLFPLESRDGKLTWQRAFSYRAISIEEESKVSTDARLSLSRMLAINPKLMGMFDKHPFDSIVFSTENLPMTVPPRPWIDRGTGGPLYNSSQEIIRKMLEFKGVRLNDEMRQRIHSRSQARPVFDALNQLGSTPWVINEPMLDTLKMVFEKSGIQEEEPLLEKLGIPMRHDTFEIPDFIREFGKIKKEEVDVDKFRDYAKRKAQAIKARNPKASTKSVQSCRIVA
uniref:DNA-directed RNA polymerase n=2 Tax=Caenorhabditis tropicalis TaxID=1561998 RepID=A0A1I7USX9_9PELO